MSIEKSYEAYGRFLVTFDRLNATLDAAIIKETGMSVPHGVLLVSTLNYKSRLSVLRGLLAQARGEKADAIPLIGEIAQDAKRQPMISGMVAAGPAGGLSFTRADISVRVGGSVVNYTADEIDGLTEELSGRIAGVAGALGVTDAALAAIRQVSTEAMAKRSKKDREVEELEG